MAIKTTMCDLGKVSKSFLKINTFSYLTFEVFIFQLISQLRKERKTKREETKL